VNLEKGLNLANLLKKQLSVLSALIITVLFSVLPADAISSLNSMCYILNKNGSKMEGQNTDALFEVASVSKVFTSYWAIHNLGAQFRFSTGVVITPLGGGLYDVHLRGSQDPFWGRQLTHLLVAELNRAGVQKIRHLSFDENFKTRWNVMVDFEQTLNPSPNDIAVSLVNHIKNLRNEYPTTLRESRLANLSLPSQVSLNIQDAIFVPSSQFQKATTARQLAIRSAPLYTYVKEMNRISNNHVADKLYEILGGNEEFKKFVRLNLGLTNSNIQFINGSGNSVVVGTGPDGKEIKSYNRTSCQSLLRLLTQFRQELKNNAHLDLQDVMAVSGEESTLNQRYDSIPNTVVAKTGTVDPAIAIAGMISTAQGDVYFGYLYKTEGPGDWNSAKDMIRNHVFDLITAFGGTRIFRYTPTPFLTFDTESAIPVVVPSVALP
jgi:D-alanyl-D-alanine carboxypeptidase/D-alanyl-D-alanine-endopeptidase (penicillin-binding protein 4)